MYEDITPGSLIRIEFEQPLRGITISAFEVAVLNVNRENNDNGLVIDVLLRPFIKAHGKLTFIKATNTWSLCFNKKTYTEYVLVRSVTLLD